MATRQEVIEAFENRMQIILPANGFVSSMGGRVTRYRKTPYAVEDTFPSLNIRDTIDRHSTFLVSASDLIEDRVITLLVDIVFQGSSPEDDVRSAVEDVLAAVGLDPTFSDTVLDFEMDEDSLQVEQDDYKLAGATLTFSLVYRRKAYGARTVTLPPGTTMSDLHFQSYVAKLSQVATGDPTPTVAGNSLTGAVVWTRTSTGTYLGTLAAAFTLGKTIFPGPNIHPTGSGDFQASLRHVSVNQVELQVLDPGGSLVDGFTDLHVSIQVYT
jgi:hypothetical protein